MSDKKPEKKFESQKDYAKDKEPDSKKGFNVSEQENKEPGKTEVQANVTLLHGKPLKPQQQPLQETQQFQQQPLQDTQFQQQKEQVFPQTTGSLQEVNFQQQQPIQQPIPPIQPIQHEYAPNQTRGETFQTFAQQPQGPELVQRKVNIVLTDTTQQQPQQPYLYNKSVTPKSNEPTINFFNRFVAKDTHCYLGRTGVKIGRITLGTMNFGEIASQFGQRPGQLSESDAHKLLDRFLELGGNAIDTADFFPWFGTDAGSTETIIGNWLAKQDRKRVFLITKVRMPIDINNINSVGLSRSHLLNAVDEALERLQTDYIDCLVINGWDNSVSFHQTVDNLHELVVSEKITYYGVADLKGWQLQKLIDSARSRSLHSCSCYMGEYNLLTRGLEWEVLDVCKRERIGFIAYSPTKYGFLSNETIESGVQYAAPGSRIESASASNLAAMAESFKSLRRNQVNMNTLNQVHFLARKYNVSASQIAIQWLLQTGVVTSICVGVSSVAELEENMSCLLGEFILNQEEMDDLNVVSNNPLQYPYHTQLAELIGVRTIQPVAGKTEFEQLGVQLSGDAAEFNNQDEIGGMRRLNMRETCHESLNQAFPERDFLRHIQMKTLPANAPRPMVQMTANVDQPEQSGRYIQ